MPRGAAAGGVGAGRGAARRSRRPGVSDPPPRYARRRASPPDHGSFTAFGAVLFAPSGVARVRSPARRSAPSVAVAADDGRLAQLDHRRARRSGASSCRPRQATCARRGLARRDRHQHLPDADHVDVLDAVPRGEVRGGRARPRARSVERRRVSPCGSAGASRLRGGGLRGGRRTGGCAAAGAGRAGGAGARFADRARVRRRAARGETRAHQRQHPASESEGAPVVRRHRRDRDAAATATRVRRAGQQRHESYRIEARSGRFRGRLDHGQVLGAALALLGLRSRITMRPPGFRYLRSAVGTCVAPAVTTIASTARSSPSRRCRRRA